MNRRDFLHPRQLAKVAAELLDVVEELQSPNHEPDTNAVEVALLRFSRQAMATTFEVIFPLGTENTLEAAEEALDEIDRLESQLTVYRDDSEVSQLNQRASAAAIPVETGLFDLLSLSRQIHNDTEAAYDIATGALIKAWGFYRRAGQVPAEEDLRRALDSTGMKHVVLDPEQRTVRYLRPGLEINLGSIGKGYALDRAAMLLRQRWQIPSALLHGGRSSVYALGTEPGQRNGWPVGIRHPWNPEQRLAVVRLRNRALGTSAATFQHLEYNGKKLGHIIDPRTGWPAEALASVSVVAPTAAEADALATAFFILGVEKARHYCAAHPQVGALLLPPEENACPIILGLGPEEIALSSGFPEENWKQ